MISCKSLFAVLFKPYRECMKSLGTSSSLQHFSSRAAASRTSWPTMNLVGCPMNKIGAQYTSWFCANFAIWKFLSSAQQWFRQIRVDGKQLW